MSVSQLDKIYNPTHIEDKWYQYWLDKNYFYSKPDSNKKPYTIVIPPPNVTGMLTVGHVLNIFRLIVLQCRHKRLLVLTGLFLRHALGN